MKNLTNSQKTMLIRIISGISLLIFCICLSNCASVNPILSASVYVLAYLIAGYDVVFLAVKGILCGRFLDEQFLMFIATVGAFFLGEFTEAVAVMLFYQVGEFFQGYAVGKSRRQISELMDISPEYASVERDEVIETVSPKEVEVGDIVIVKPGEKIPVDGVVVEGMSFVDTSSITGESVHKEILPGSNVVSGCINVSSLLKIRAERNYENSTVSKILQLIEESSFNKSKSENFISKFAKVYTPLVVMCALLVFTIGGIITMNFSVWLERALIFLVVSCPCALVVSVPLSFFAAIGCGSKEGILMKGSNWIEALSKAQIIVFDKTGTLTKGNFVISGVYPHNGYTKEEVLKKAYISEYYSIHPISAALKLEDIHIRPDEISDFENLPGLGVKALYEGEILRCGSEKYIRSFAKDMPGFPKPIYTTIHLCEADRYLGHIVISDEIKSGAKDCISWLKKMGIKTMIFTGDTPFVANHIGELMGVDKVESGLLPHDKTEKFAKLKEEKFQNSTVVFVGEGINDAPTLSMADVGVAMGNLGSDAAVEAADIVIMNDDILKIPFAIRLCKKTVAIVKQNVIFSIGIKMLVMILAGVGMANMWLAVFADVGVAILAVLNAFRAFKVKM